MHEDLYRIDRNSHFMNHFDKIEIVGIKQSTKDKNT
jgi:hypothetical protein